MNIKKILGAVAIGGLMISSQASAVSCYTFNTNLAVGSKRVADVSALQDFLLSYKGGSLVNSNTSISYGKYDKRVANIVKVFQRQQGISQTGTLGPATRKAINAIYSCTATPVSTVPAINSFTFNDKNWERAYVSFDAGNADQFPAYTTTYLLKGENIANETHFIDVMKVVKTKQGIVPNVANLAINLGMDVQSENSDTVISTKLVDIRGEGKEFTLSYMDTRSKLDPVLFIVKMYQQGDSVVEIFYGIHTNSLPEIKVLADNYMKQLNQSTTAWSESELQAKFDYIRNVGFELKNKERDIFSRLSTGSSSIPSDQDSSYSLREEKLGDLRFNK